LKNFGPVPSIKYGEITLTYHPLGDKSNLTKIRFFGKELKGGKIDSDKKESEPGVGMNKGGDKGKESDNKKRKGGDKAKPGKKIHAEEETDS